MFLCVVCASTSGVIGISTCVCALVRERDYVCLNIYTGSWSILFVPVGDILVIIQDDYFLTLDWLYDCLFVCYHYLLSFSININT